MSMVYVLYALSALTAYRVAALSTTSLALIGGIIVVLIAAGIGIVFYLRRKRAASKRAIPLDTFILPQLPRADVTAALSKSNTNEQSSSSSAPPIYRAVPAPAEPDETVRLADIQAKLPDGYNAQATSHNVRRPSLVSSLPTRLPETPRPHPQVSGDSQQQARYEGILEAMIRQAQRGIFATPGKDDLS